MKGGGSQKSQTILQQSGGTKTSVQLTASCPRDRSSEEAMDSITEATFPMHKGGKDLQLSRGKIGHDATGNLGQNQYKLMNPGDVTL